MYIIICNIQFMQVVLHWFMSRLLVPLAPVNVMLFRFSTVSLNQEDF